MAKTNNRAKAQRTSATTSPARTATAANEGEGKRAPARKRAQPARSASATGTGGATFAAFGTAVETGAQLQGLLASLSDERRAEGIELLNQLAAHTSMRLRLQVKQFIQTNNVDTGASDKERATAFVAIARQAVSELDGSNKDNVVTFLVRTAWHEGAALTKRVQSGGGPARSFMQMEPGAAKDGVARAQTKGWLAKLATASGNTEADLSAAAADLTLGKPWPAGNLIEEALKTFDLFGVEVARAYLSTGSTTIPVDRDAQADYWESDWHRTPDAAKKAQWLANAKTLDKLLGWS